MKTCKQEQNTNYKTPWSWAKKQTKKQPSNFRKNKQNTAHWQSRAEQRDTMSSNFSTPLHSASCTAAVHVPNAFVHIIIIYYTSFTFGGAAILRYALLHYEYTCSYIYIYRSGTHTPECKFCATNRSQMGCHKWGAKKTHVAIALGQYRFPVFMQDKPLPLGWPGEKVGI